MAEKKHRSKTLKPSKPLASKSKKLLSNPADKYKLPAIDKPAPDFSLPDSNGTQISLKKYLGKKIILYFYPKDDTPGCTIEARGFQDDYESYLAAGAAVIGISKDTCDSHRKFAEKHGLKFILLSDVDGGIVQRYGCWVEKNLYGKRYMGILRATFIIDEKGILRKIFTKVSPGEHSQEVLYALKFMK